MQMFWLPCSTSECFLQGTWATGHSGMSWTTPGWTLCMTELITGLQTLKPEQWAFWKLSSYAVKHKHVLQLLETTITDTVPFYWVRQRSRWWGNAGKMTQEEDSGNEWKGETGLAAGTKASIDTRCFLQLTLHFSFTAAEKRQFCAI